MSISTSQDTHRPPHLTVRLAPVADNVQNSLMRGLKVGDGGDSSMELIARILRCILRWGVHSSLCRVRGCDQNFRRLCSWRWIPRVEREKVMRSWEYCVTCMTGWRLDEPHLRYSQYRIEKEQFWTIWSRSCRVLTDILVCAKLIPILWSHLFWDP